MFDDSGLKWIQRLQKTPPNEFGGGTHKRRHRAFESEGPSRRERTADWCVISLEEDLMKVLFFGVASLCVALLSTVESGAMDSVVPGEFFVEPPTLLCAGFEWKIEGDDNRNSNVQVTYRKKGTSEWKQGMPLLRLQGEWTYHEKLELDYRAPNMFAGSLFELEPGTEYECRFVMSDPDGVQGEPTKSLTVTTREVPKAPEGGRVLHVYPKEYQGSKEEPSYPDLLWAYYGGGQGYWGGPQVKPGDTILVHAGVYRADWRGYSSHLNLDFYGTYVLSQDGTADKPIVIKAAGDGEVVFDGDDCHKLFDVTAADYTYFEDLTICNADVAIFAGLRHVGGCDGLVVRNCILENVGVGIQGQYVGSKNFYIADNVILGRDGRRRVHGWTGGWDEYGIPSKLRSFIGVDVNGQGHAVCHNYVAYFHDAIDVTQQGPPETDDPSMKAASIDFYNNDIHLMADDFFEADCGVHNIRVFRNRCVNTAHAGLSAQPMYGGPCYFIRNILYHVPEGGLLKFNINPSGIFILHNTFCGEWAWGSPFSNVHVRNNLFLGTDTPNRPILHARTYTSYSDFDYNGYRMNEDSEVQMIWQSPPEGVLQEYDLSKCPSQSFGTFEEFQKGSGQEEDGMVVDYNVFAKVNRPDPDRPGHVYRAADMDFSLMPGSVPVDAGCVLPNLNDDYAGNAPDLGALELGRSVPTYGPRHLKAREGP